MSECLRGIAPCLYCKFISPSTQETLRTAKYYLLHSLTFLKNFMLSDKLWLMVSFFKGVQGQEIYKLPGDSS